MNNKNKTYVLLFTGKLTHIHLKMVDGVLSDIMHDIDISPWMHLIHQKMSEIEEGRSGIRKYGAANEIEFLSVASELFFENPDKMEKEHPKLFKALDAIFNPSKEM